MNKLATGDHTLSKVGIAVLIALVLGVMSWVAVSLQENTKTNRETHDQVLVNTVKLNDLMEAKKEVVIMKDSMRGLEYRVTTLEDWRIRHESHPETRKTHP